MQRKPINLLPLVEEYHSADNFREQIAVLIPEPIQEGDTHVRMLRSYHAVCQPSVAGFDPENPGEETTAGWEVLRARISNENVRGTFHTHPPGVSDFSQHDLATQRALAQALGPTYLWHGVQAVGEESAHWFCVHMLGGKNVHIYDLGWVDSKPSDYTLVLPLPPLCKAVAPLTFLWEAH